MTKETESDCKPTSLADSYQPASRAQRPLSSSNRKAATAGEATIIRRAVVKYSKVQSASSVVIITERIGIVVGLCCRWLDFFEAQLPALLRPGEMDPAEAPASGGSRSN